MPAFDVKLSELVKAITAGVEGAIRRTIGAGKSVSQVTIETAIRNTFGGKPMIRYMDVTETWQSSALNEPWPNTIMVLNNSALDVEIRYDRQTVDGGVRVVAGGSLGLDTYGAEIPYIYHRIWAGAAGSVQVSLLQIVPDW